MASHRPLLSEFQWRYACEGIEGVGPPVNRRFMAAEATTSWQLP